VQYQETLAEYSLEMYSQGEEKQAELYISCKLSVVSVIAQLYLKI